MLCRHSVRESLIYRDNYLLILWVHHYPNFYIFLSCNGLINNQGVTGYETGKVSGPRLIMGHSTNSVVNGSHESLVITVGKYRVINRPTHLSVSGTTTSYLR